MPRSTVFSAMLLGLALLAVAGCDSTRKPLSGAGAGFATTQLGFTSLASATQLGEWWTAQGGPKNVSGAWLAPDKASFVLELRRSQPMRDRTGSSSVQADAVLVSVQPVNVKPLSLNGEIVMVDFQQGTLELRVFDTSGREGRDSYKLADGSISRLEYKSEPEMLEEAVAGGVNPPAFPLPHSLEVKDYGQALSSWVYDEPSGHNAGSSRSSMEDHPGRLCVMPLDNTEREGARRLEVQTGTLSFTQLAGNWAERRAMLCAPGAGVLLADFKDEAAPQCRWVLRDDGSTGLFLQAESDCLLALTDEGIFRIGCGELAQLAPRLAVGAQLSAAQTRRLKPAVEALGWEWDKVQLSPLRTSPGVLHLFDTADLDSTTAELDWNIEAQRAERLLIARNPRAADETLRQALPDQQRRTVQDLLRLLGWPKAAWPSAEESGSDAQTAEQGATKAADGPPTAADEAVLNVAVQAASASSEFGLWLTPSAALWSLDS